MKGQANKRTIGTVLLTIWVSSSQAQTPTDSTVTLGEVMVKAHTMIRRLDRTLFLPTREAKRSAYNPYDLMCSMTMPHVQVDPLAKTVSANGGAVQLRINGIKAAQTEVAALLPKDIVRIELIENPGKRYGDEQLGAVIDIIVRNRDAGGLINIQTTNSPIVAFGENTLSAKYNQGHAQWGVSYSNNYRGLHHQHTDKTEDFVLGNTTIHRVQQGQDDRSDWNDHTVDLSYNYILPDRYTFNAVLRSYSKQAPHQDETSLINDRITAHTALQAHNWSPSLDLYFQRTLPHQQTLSLNLTGTLINADRNRRYTETITQVKPLADIVTNTEGRKRSIIAEAIYDKQFTTIALSAGLRHYQMHDRDEYTGASPVVSEMDQSRSSFFAEILGRWKMLNYGFSAGATRSWFSENGKHQTYFIFTPTVRLAIAPHKNGYLN
ncbi:MAG: hypothetical protein MSD82_05155 [Prevotella sp.]|nr:hypothetical protein [Prevotella sp.]